ncbi:MAG: hypoxanthine phosphoribosyltransferase [Candidatus Aquicultorales bacterium]
MHDDIDRVLISEVEIAEKVAEMGFNIARDYESKDVVLVNVLKGGVIFLADLIREIDIPITVDFMAVTSYGAASQTSGVVRVLKDLDEDIEGRHVIVVEDIIDTGLTLGYLLKNLKVRSPESLTVCTLLDKSARRLLMNLPIKYKGFDVPDQFVVGYGLDYRQRYRNLPFIGVLKPHVYQS